MIFLIGVVSTPRFLTWVVCGGEESLEHWAKSSMGVDGEGDKDWMKGVVEFEGLCIRPSLLRS
jgi:hypothetical protein